MPIVKYYQKTTWYSGWIKSGFYVIGERPKTEGEWFYPDEYLIAHILRQYCRKRGIAKQFEIIVLHEPWSLSPSSPIPRDLKGATRDNGDLLTEGEENSGYFNRIIEQAVRERRQKKQVLILAPFLLGRHHPGIAIDMRHNRAVYLDPKQFEPYKKAQSLLDMLASQGISTEQVTIQQQHKNDSYSCGPILTASMMQWIEEFIQGQPISSKNFTANRQGLAADRLFQMYVNNNPIPDEKTRDNLVNEIMLADIQLWKDFLQEMQTPDTKELMQLIREDVEQHKTWIAGIVSPHRLSDLDIRKLQWIVNYQARMIECIFLDEKPLDKIAELHTFNRQFFAEPTQEHSSKIAQVKKRDLLQDPYFSQIYTKLQKLGCRAALMGKPKQTYNSQFSVLTWFIFLLLSALIFLILYASDILLLPSPWFLLLIIPAASLLLTASWYIATQIFCNQKPHPLHLPLPAFNPQTTQEMDEVKLNKTLHRPPSSNSSQSESTPPFSPST